MTPLIAIVPIEALLDPSPADGSISAAGNRLLLEADVVIAFHPSMNREFELFQRQPSTGQPMRVLKVSLDAVRDRMAELCLHVHQAKGHCNLRHLPD